MRCVVVAAALAAVLLSAACSEPPQKEIDRAQGAIDAARAAGAEQYAPEAFDAATDAMQETHDAVQQRDYRLALSRAIDANDRALEAARLAASNKAQARSEADALIGKTLAAIRQLDEQLKAATAARVGARDTAAARKTRAAAESAVQEARAAVKNEDYLGAQAALKGVMEKIAAEIDALGQVIEKAGRGARRRR